MTTYFSFCDVITRRRHGWRCRVKVEQQLVAAAGNDPLRSRQVPARHRRRVTMTDRLQQQPVDALVKLVSHGQLNVRVGDGNLYTTSCLAEFKQTI